VESPANVKINIHFSPLTHQAICLIVEGYQVKHDFPFPNPCWLFPDTFLPFVCLEMFSRIICSIILPVIEVRLPGL